MWHASVANGKVNDLKRLAFAALNGVGANLLGEWEQWTGRAFHLRRRLRPEEEAMVGPALDVRGTTEARLRLQNVRRWLPPGWNE